MKKMKRISLSLFLLGTMFVVFSAQKPNLKKKVKPDRRHVLLGKKMSKVELKKLNLKLLKAGKIATMSTTPECDSGDKQTFNAQTQRVDVPGPPPQVCEQVVIACTRPDKSTYSKYGAYTRCSEKKPIKDPTKTPPEKLPTPS